MICHLLFQVFLRDVPDVRENIPQDLLGLEFIPVTEVDHHCAARWVLCQFEWEVILPKPILTTAISPSSLALIATYVSENRVSMQPANEPVVLAHHFGGVAQFLQCTKL